ncbi:hypothetical protein MCOR25_007400 [Pyricularia grisea]|nr:hypothetical protein MCOR25_007400 [Pyricularia grisea]
MANYINPTNATTTPSSYYGSRGQDPAANAPEVVPTDVPPHSRGDNQPQMMGMDWQGKGKPVMQTYYDPKIGTYPESVPVTTPSYHAKVATPSQGAPTPPYRNDVDDTPLEAVVPGQFSPYPATGIYSDKAGAHPVGTVQELRGFRHQGAGDDGSQVLEKRVKRRNKVLGVPVAVFWALLVLIVLAAVGLGAGLGVGLSQRNNGSGTSAANPESQQTDSAPTKTTSQTQGAPGSTSTATSTTTTTQPAVTAGTRGLAANSCNFDGSKVYTSGAEKFEAFCSVDWPQGVGAASGSGTVKDVDKALVYSFEDCMGECVKYNEKLPDVRCVAVTYNSNLTDFFPTFGANCFLKDKKGQNYPGKDTSACAAML